VLEPEIESLISRALAEDVGVRDVTTEVILEAGARAQGRITRKEPGVIYGLEVAESVFRHLDPDVEWRAIEQEGRWHEEAPAVIAELAGDARALLTGERVALNFLQRLSGVATLTARCVAAVEGTGVEVLDTRKTTPGLRLLEKRAVAAGGGTNHRFGLSDAILIKENHIAFAGSVAEATRRALAGRPPDSSVEVECRNLAEVEEALDAGAERILLDNMQLGDVERAVKMAAGKASVEASGGVTLASLPEVASAGVQFVSLGALTHSAPALDLSMSLEPA
jgi:nicotinate-nucleotide pyrophosphorylase (carboxylating)